MNKYIQLIILVLYAFSFFGCSLNSLKWWGKTPAPMPLPQEEFPVNTGRIISPAYIQEGGRIFVVPFTAGVDVESNEELDRTVLRMTKGIIDALEENDSSFKVVDAEQEEFADFIIRGHVIDLSRPGKFGRWFLLKNAIAFGVEGRMVDKVSDEIVLRFSYQEEGKQGQDDHRDLAYQVGYKIGMFLANEVEP